jgi:hypothetical protein
MTIVSEKNDGVKFSGKKRDRSDIGEMGSLISGAVSPTAILFPIRE